MYLKYLRYSDVLESVKSGISGFPRIPKSGISGPRNVQNGVFAKNLLSRKTAPTHYRRKPGCWFCGFYNQLHLKNLRWWVFNFPILGIRFLYKLNKYFFVKKYKKKEKKKKFFFSRNRIIYLLEGPYLSISLPRAARRGAKFRKSP